ncbi:MAG: nitrile hydratase subunit alpha [Pseudomonadota bacterium]
MSHDHDHDHDHNDEHTHPTQEDNDLTLTSGEAKFIALREMLIEKGIITGEEVRKRLEFNDSATPHQGARMVARAWVDPEYKTRMLADGKKAAIELGIDVVEAEIMVIENTVNIHNLVVCTLCSCYPRSLLGEPPAWYVSKAYRSRAVREPRAVMQEFGLTFPRNVEVRVHDSNADLRYLILPMRPAGTQQLTENELANLVSRDCLVGMALPGTN